MAGTLRRLTGPVAGALVLLAALPAFAQQRVAVLGFGGPSGGAVRAAVARAVGESYEVVDLGEWQEAADRLGARGQGAGPITRVAAELGVTAVISGGVQRARRAWAVTVVVRDGGNGAVLGRPSRIVNAPGRAGAVAGGLADEAVALVADATGPSGPGPSGGGGGGGPDFDFSGDAATAETERPPGLTSDPGGAQAADEELPPGGDDERPRRRRVRDRDEEEEAEDAEDEDDGDDEAPAGGGSGSRRGSPHGFLEIGLDFNMTERAFKVAINPDCDTRNPPRNRIELDTSVYSEMGARLAFYPGAIVSDRWFAHLGLEFAYAHHLVLKIVNESQGVPVEASSQTIGLGLVYRLPIVRGRRVISILPRLGWGRYNFVLGNVGNSVVPPFTYDHIYLGLNTHFDLLPRWLGLGLGLHYLGVITPGPDAVATYNGNGMFPASHGVLLGLSLSGQIFRGLRWAVAFEFEGFFTTNQGKGRGWGSGDDSTLCDSTECMNAPSCSVTGGIETASRADDLIWRLGLELQYRFGWHPGERAAPERRRRERDRDEEPRDDDDTRDRGDSGEVEDGDVSADDEGYMVVGDEGLEEE